MAWMNQLVCLKRAPGEISTDMFHLNRVSIQIHVFRVLL